MDKIQPVPDLFQASPSLSRQEMHFSNGNTAIAVTVPPTAPAPAVLDALGIQKPEALFIVIGGADNLDESLNARLELLCSLGIACVAARMKSLIIDGGTQAGIMAMMGQGVADRDHASTLLGVSPAGLISTPDRPNDNAQFPLVPLDPNHSHFALVEGNAWGDETNMMYKLARALSQNKKGEKIPVVTIVVNGGELVQSEVWHSVQLGWPIIVIEGSDRMADKIAKLWREKHERQESKRRSLFSRSQQKNTTQQLDFAAILDPQLTEIIEKGDIHLFPIDGPTEQFEKLLMQLLYRSDVLSQAWELFALYDQNAKRQQANFFRLQRSIVGVGVLVTAVVVLQVLLRSHNLLSTGTPLDQAIHAVIVLLPIIISILVAGASRFTPGNKWILLRAAAEAIKREIYCYRTETGNYEKNTKPSTDFASHQRQKLLPQEIFTQGLAGINRHLMQSEINASALRPYTGIIPPAMYGVEAKDDGYSKLTPERYIAIRLGDQLTYFRSKANALAKDLTRCYWLIFITGGLGTLLAALGLEPVVALTAALAAAFASYLEYRQIEYTVIKYNQTASNLSNVMHLWEGLPENEHSESFSQLVSTTEQILATENLGWVQQMHDALMKLRDTQQKMAESEPEHDQTGQGEQD